MLYPAIPPDLSHAAGLQGNHIRDFGPGRDLGHPAEHQFGDGIKPRLDLHDRRQPVRVLPIGFCLIVCGKAVCLGCSIAMILHAFGLAGDPAANIKHALPFLP